MSKILLITTVLLCAAATTACTSQIRQSVHADQEIEKDVAISHGESKTRAEVNADLVLWKRAGLDKLWRGHGSPDTFTPQYKAAYAEYVRLRSGPEYQQEVQRQSARSEERRVGKECVSPCRSGWSTYH